MTRVGGLARWSHTVERWLFDGVVAARVRRVLIPHCDLFIGDELVMHCDEATAKVRVTEAVCFRLRMYDNGFGWVVTLGLEELSSSERRSLSDSLGFDSIVGMRKYVERLGLKDALLLSVVVLSVNLPAAGAAGEGGA